MPVSEPQRRSDGLTSIAMTVPRAEPADRKTSGLYCRDPVERFGRIQELNDLFRRSARTLIPGLLTGGVVFVLVTAGSGRGFAQGDSARWKNPVASDASSVAAGKKLFTSNCSSCHGESGRGDGKSAASLNPKPSDLTDTAWKHGQSDGEIFTLIRDGAKQTSMRGYAGRMTSQEIWRLVNYVRSLGPASKKSL